MHEAIRFPGHVTFPKIDTGFALVKMIYLVDRLRADAVDDDFPARYRRRHARDLGHGQVYRTIL